MRRRVGAELPRDIQVEDRWTVRHFRQISIQEIDEVPQNELQRLGITAAAVAPSSRVDQLGFSEPLRFNAVGAHGDTGDRSPNRRAWPRFAGSAPVRRMAWSVSSPIPEATVAAITGHR